MKTETSTKWSLEKNPAGLGWFINRPITQQERQTYRIPLDETRPMSILGVDSYDTAVVVEEADARLVVAAPDMLKALQDAEEQLTKLLESRLMDSTSAPFHSVRRIRDGITQQISKTLSSK